MSTDPLNLRSQQDYPSHTIHRIQRDLQAINLDPPPGIMVSHEESDISVVHALITGPNGTPYEGGFFYFVLRFPIDYPINPPDVRLMTTGGSKVRFNPNLYSNGRVCLSILGTWEGPAWSPVQTLESVLISIQSLMCEHPFYNEPMYASGEKRPEASQLYNDFVQHETIRVAVIGMVDNEYELDIPECFMDEMEFMFLQMYQRYEELAKNKEHLSGKPMTDHFGSLKRVYDWKGILKQLRRTRDRLDSPQQNETVTNSITGSNVSV